MANATQAAFSSEVIANTESYTHSLTLTVWVAEDSFGNLLSEQNLEQINNPWRFSSKYFENENGLTYFGYRYYSPRDGRFVSEDPIGERGGMLLYGYCGNDGINQSDKWGLMSVQDINYLITQRRMQMARKTCSCLCKPVKVSVSISGSSGSSWAMGLMTIVNGNDPCVRDLKIYWWDCYSAAHEVNGASGWQNYGWSAGGLLYSKTAEPSSYAWLSWLAGYDPYHLAMVALVIYDSCDSGKITSVEAIPSNQLLWSWDSKTKAWK